MIRKLIYTALILFILLDTGYSFLQHYHMPFDGDMPESIVPAQVVEPVLSSPLGVKVFAEGVTYPNPNRFFSHWIFHHYFNKVPRYLQHIVPPLESAYLACAIFKIIVQMALVLLLTVAITGKRPLLSYSSVLTAALIVPLFQTNGYFHYMGIIDQSTTYTFFYAFPITLLVVYFLPLFVHEYYDWQGRRSRYIGWLWIPLALVVSLSGPLNPGIALTVGFLWLVQKVSKGNLIHQTDNTSPKPTRLQLFYMIPIILFSLYSLYLGQYNANTLSTEIPLAERYARLSLGIYYQFTQKLGFPILFSILIVNFLLIQFNFRNAEGKKIIHLAKWIAAFAVLYILLLPLGGYREYRPYILRYDTILPITLSLLFLFGKTTMFLLQQLTIRQRRWYIPLILLVLFIFTNADEPEFFKNDCEKKAILEIAESPQDVVKVDEACTVLSWTRITRPEDSALPAQLLYIWRIIDKEKLYYQ